MCWMYQSRKKNPQFLHENRWLIPFAEISHRVMAAAPPDRAKQDRAPAGKRPRSENPLGKTSRKTTWWFQPHC